MDWTVGGFYYDGESVNNQIVSIPFLGFVVDIRPFPFDDPSKPFVNTDNVHENNNESVFAHAVFDITDKLALTAGVRYSSDEKVVGFDNTRVQNPHVVVEGDNTDYKLGLDYQFTPDMLAYASWSTGYRPGSYNPRPFQATQVVAVDAEDSEAYELGVQVGLVRPAAADQPRRVLHRLEDPHHAGGRHRVHSAWTWDRRPSIYPDDPNTPGSVTDSLGNVCEAVTSQDVLREHAGRGRGRRGRGQLGAGRRAGVQRPVRLDRLGVAGYHRQSRGDQRATAVRARGQLGAERVLRLDPRQRSEPDAAAGLLRPGGDLLGRTC